MKNKSKSKKENQPTHPQPWVLKDSQTGIIYASIVCVYLVVHHVWIYAGLQKDEKTHSNDNAGK